MANFAVAFKLWPTMRPITFLPIAIAALVLSSCSTSTIEVEAHPVAGVDYSSYKTYEWVPIDRGAADEMTEGDKEVRAAFVAEVDSILAKRGYTKVGQGQSDLLVYARGITATGTTIIGQGASSNQRIYSPYYEPNDQGSSWLGEAGYLSSTTQTSARFLITEPSTDKIVWQGKARITLDERRKHAAVLRDAQLVARQLLKGFPSSR